MQLKYTYPISVVFAIFILFSACQNSGEDKINERNATPSNNPYLVILGIAQDAGYPQAGCHRTCCQKVADGIAKKQFATSLAIIDPASKERWLIEATPDFREQLSLLDSISPPQDKYGINGIFLTHAHMGHYAGLIHLGREAMGATEIPVYTLPVMNKFLATNGPWSLLAKLKNIKLVELNEDSTIQLNPRIRITPFTVPHRDEFSETAGFIIETNNRSAIFIPDIDKWEKWNTPVESLIKKADYAFLDATFYQNGELPGRDMSEIPHPFVEESITRFSALSETERSRIHFIHFNHTNPLLDIKSQAINDVEAAGFNISRQGMRIEL